MGCELKGKITAKYKIKCGENTIEYKAEGKDIDEVVHVIVDQVKNH